LRFFALRVQNDVTIIMNLSALPTINASLNALSAMLLITGYYFIKQKRVTAHKICMSAAGIASCLFLVLYLYYHAHQGSTPFQGQGMIRTVYFTVLISHTTLAVLQLPLILLTFYRAIRGQIDEHKAIAKITLPIWLYVSVTGVVVYWMLYRL